MALKTFLGYALFILILVPTLSYSAEIKQKTDFSDVRLQENDWIRIISVNKSEESYENFSTRHGLKTPDFLKDKIIRSLIVKILFLQYCEATTKEDKNLKNASPFDPDAIINHVVHLNEYVNAYRCSYKTTVFASFYDKNNIEFKSEGTVPLAHDKNEILPGEAAVVIFTIPDEAQSWKVWVPK